MSIATDMVIHYVAAEKAVLNGKSYSISGRTMTRENLQEIRNGRAEWEARVSDESATKNGGSRLFSLAEFSE